MPPKAIRFPKSVTSHAISVSPSLEDVPSAPAGNPFAAAALSRWSRGLGRSVDHGAFTVIFVFANSKARGHSLTHKLALRHDNQQQAKAQPVRGSGGAVVGESGVGRKKKKVTVPRESSFRPDSTQQQCFETTAQQTTTPSVHLEPLLDGNTGIAWGSWMISVRAISA